MELSKTILNAVTPVGDISETPETLFNSILHEIFDIAVSKPFVTKGNDEKFKKMAEKTAYTSLLCLLFEAAKNDIDTASFSSVLEECRWENDRIQIFIKKYQDFKEKIQAQLAIIGSSYDHIVDVKWRQDFVVKSSNCEKISELNYLISLKVWNSHLNTEKDITFSCTMEQLQDLVSKLKDATKCIERNAM